MAGLANMHLDSRKLDRFAVQSQTLSQRKAFIYAADRRTLAKMLLVPEIVFL